jgi:heme exporter protein CcmD
MSSYAVYVWTAYGITAVVLIGLAIASFRALKAREAELARAEAASPRGKR